MKNKMKKFLVLAILAGVIAMVFLSGCTQTTEKPPVVDYKSVAKGEVESKYSWNITQTKSQMYNDGLSNEAINSQTEIELESVTKESIIANASDYELTQDDINELQNMSPEDFKQLKEDNIKPGVIDTVKASIKKSLDELVAGFNFSILEVKSKEEVPNIDTYLNSFGLDAGIIQQTKKKLEKGEYIVVVELNLQEKRIIPEVCDDKGKIIKE